MSLFDVLASSIAQGKNLFKEWSAKALTEETARDEPGDHPQMSPTRMTIAVRTDRSSLFSKCSRQRHTLNAGLFKREVS